MYHAKRPESFTALHHFLCCCIVSSSDRVRMSRLRLQFISDWASTCTFQVIHIHSALGHAADHRSSPLGAILISKTWFAHGLKEFWFWCNHHHYTTVTSCAICCLLPTAHRSGAYQLPITLATAPVCSACSLANWTFFRVALARSVGSFGTMPATFTEGSCSFYSVPGE